MGTAKKGKFTFRTTAVFFILSAVVELVFLNSDVALFGAIRGGPAAVLYHLIYAAIFIILGAGLWNARPWGYRAVLGFTVYYTLDVVQAWLSRQAVQADFMQQLAGYEDTFQQAGVDKEAFQNLLLNTITIVPLVVLLCWWGFAWYTHIHRDYFQSEARDTDA